jgi:hypothetical protein
VTPLLRGNPNQPYEELKRTSADARRHIDRETWLNVAFYLNEQWAGWAVMKDGSGHLIPPPTQTDLPTQDRRDRPTINKIMHFVEQNVASRSSRSRRCGRAPGDDDPMALSDAGVGNAYIQWLTDPTVENWERKLEERHPLGADRERRVPQVDLRPTLRRPVIKFVPSTDLYADPYVRDFYKTPAG